MKKFGLLTALIVLLALPSFSSGQFGIKAGLNVSGLSGDYTYLDYVVDLKTQSGLRIGGFYCFDLGGGLQIQPEIYFAQKGAGIEHDEVYYYTLSYTIRGKLKLDYIEIPVLVKYRLQSGSTQPFFFAGPYLAFKASAKVETSATIAGYDMEAESGDLDEVKSTDFGLVVGAGIRVPVGKVDLIVDARYTLGLSNISDVVDEKIRNGTFSILFGVGL